MVHPYSKIYGWHRNNAEEACLAAPWVTIEIAIGFCGRSRTQNIPGRRDGQPRHFTVAEFHINGGV